MEQKRILLIEDDQDLRGGLQYDLERENYTVSAAATLQEGRELLKKQGADLILLDGNLPDGDGFDFCAAVKKEEDIPILFLTGRGMEWDEIRGFDCGADDYIIKPFRIPILHRRIEAALRKYGKKPGARCYDDGYLKIDFDTLAASRENAPLSLTPTEYKILSLLLANRDRVVTKTLLLEKVWDSSGNFVDEHAVAVNMNRLRKKIEGAERTYIKTLYGMGYQWVGGNGTWNG
ncbi:MAG TPA: response regulator transcription factor [Candidatus Blautia merdavium]|uniref:Stage 0 sporulation protein A homolog n=1 Tax=Candidatus Blautia merdavium TaxID=2838494 RepID=A0A9D2PPA4_9FIRM|nr:response regulator transcription factor [Candidatus Blautia merdavium]